MFYCPITALTNGKPFIRTYINLHNYNIRSDTRKSGPENTCTHTAHNKYEYNMYWGFKVLQISLVLFSDKHNTTVINAIPTQNLTWPPSLGFTRQDQNWYFLVHNSSFNLIQIDNKKIPATCN